MGERVDLSQLDFGIAALEMEWMITVDTPDAGVPGLLRALEENIPLRQGHYECCTFLQSNGHQRFRALSGSHAGNEGSLQQTPASQIIFSISPDEALLRKTFETLFKFHVNEEPTIRVQTVWGSRSRYLDDKDNPNRYWNRADADELHGTAMENQ